MIKLTDTMVINGASTDSAALVESTVKLYSYNAATGQKGTELPSDSYRVDYAETSSNPHTYTLTVEVPNGFAYVLEYQYANTSNTDYSMEIRLSFPPTSPKLLQLRFSIIVQAAVLTQTV